VQASDRTSLLTRFKNRILLDPAQRRIEFIPESEASGELSASAREQVQQRDRPMVLQYVLSEPLHRIINPAADKPPPDEKECQLRMAKLGYVGSSEGGAHGNRPHACTSLGRLTAFASWLGSENPVDADYPGTDRSTEAQRRVEGEQLIDIIDYDEELLKLAGESEPSVRDILRHPIARIPVKGERITGLRFTTPGEPGSLQVQFDSGSRIDIAWGREALLKRACAILAQIDDEARERVIRSGLHTPFFKQIVNAEGGIIARNKCYERVCGVGDCSAEESD